VQATLRVVHEPVDLAGIALPDGARAALMLGAAHRDPTAYPDADRSNITRDRTDPDHLAFSSGIHHCLGASFARLEDEIALRAPATCLTRPVRRTAGATAGQHCAGFAAIPMTPGVQGVGPVILPRPLTGRGG
jgi:cytochrome P450